MSVNLTRYKERVCAGFACLRERHAESQGKLTSRRGFIKNWNINDSSLKNCSRGKWCWSEFPEKWATGGKAWIHLIGANRSVWILLSLQSSHLICHHFIGVVASQPHRGGKKKRIGGSRWQLICSELPRINQRNGKRRQTKVAVLFFDRRIP